MANNNNNTRRENLVIDERNLKTERQNGTSATRNKVKGQNYGRWTKEVLIRKMDDIRKTTNLRRGPDDTIKQNGHMWLGKAQQNSNDGRFEKGIYVNN